MSEKSKRTTVYFDSDLHHALRVKAVGTNRSVSELVNEAVQLSLGEDAGDLDALATRMQEPNLLFENVVKDLKRRGKV